MTYKHLKERSYYEEMYDRHTVEDCRWHEEPRPMSKEENDVKEGLTAGQIQWSHDFVTDMLLFQRAGDRYLQREETINEWMERDERRDAVLDRARTPIIRCPSCGRSMECVYKRLDYDIDDRKREWVEFILKCMPCKQSARVFENGQKVPEKPSLCVKCKKEVKLSTRTKNGKEYFIDTCKHCGHVEETLSVLDEDKKEPTQEEIDRFEYDKKRFCLTSAQGQRYKSWVEGMKLMKEETKEQEANVEYYDKLAEVKKLNIAGLEKLLKAVIKKAGYTDLHISMPPPDRQIIINFSVRDTEEKRESYDSEKTLQKIFEKALEDKNWALVSDGIHYRLGLLSGRIQGYETEEDLETLTKARVKKSMKAKKPKAHSEVAF
ncbi:MAG: Uncharacterized protein G01um101425_386 [Candidatus Peregrinibacteria bacterium Gr01-1014_25]|nr:MAG: Uncharacterized protein G01um101425_386 [Candidatus Peregrinibacteria bacterium Gr01-1014_25]